MTQIRRLLCAAAWSSLAFQALAQQLHPVTRRPIAPVMGAAGADWLDREERMREEHPERALEAMDLKPGMVVADLGAGTGFYTFRIAPKVLPGGKVFATDLQPAMLNHLRNNATSRHADNVSIVQGSETDCNLPPESIDLLLMVDVYHELSHPQQILRSVRRSLKPQGRLLLLEFRKEDPAVPIRREHEMSVRDVEAEVTPEGFVLDRVVETLPWQHMIFFRAVAARQ